ncbi:UBC-like protein [Rhodofomes roseus]|uniref:UBC-like protein n=1 Tax=Rhodofomes roseus TaxID=34475 RepID=A0ABQ8KVR8_9APHY|nr:UBC-like protein [Rhodofomes roseus]KAH9842906.1 UBC-like protein [Rhodofomes roseus]
MARLNKNNSAVKRIMQEARELANDPCTDYSAAPLEDDIFEWHCTLRGPNGTEFEGGVYHFRILLPAEYPFRPPSIMMLTPNGRFELNTKICISFTSYHEELWQPAWGVRTAIVGLQGFFPLKGTAAVGVGALEYPVAERKRLAALSREWVCPKCNCTNLELLPDPPSDASRAAPPNAESQITEVPAASPGPLTPATPAVIADVKQKASADEPPRAQVDAPSPSIPIVAPRPQRPSPPPSILTTPIDTTPTPRTVSPRPDGASSAQLQQAAGPKRDAQSSGRPPVLLDTAICVLLVLLFALIVKRFL